MPDFYTRVHAQTVIVVGGVTLALLGLMIANPEYWLKIALIISFLLITSPTGSHAIARAAYKSGQKPWGRP